MWVKALTLVWSGRRGQNSAAVLGFGPGIGGPVPGIGFGGNLPASGSGFSFADTIGDSTDMVWDKTPSDDDHHSPSSESECCEGKADYMQVKVAEPSHAGRILSGLLLVIRLIVLVAVAVALIGVVVVVIGWVIQGRSDAVHLFISGVLVAAIALVVILMIVVSRTLRRRSFAAVLRLIPETPEIDERHLLREFSRRLSGVKFQVLIQHVPSLFVAKGIIGKTYELWARDRPGSVEPLRIRFEPRLLDEADIAFDELASALESPTDPNEQTPAQLRRMSDEVLGDLKRNIGLRGSWALIILNLIIVAAQTVLSIQSGRLHLGLLIGLASLALICFATDRMGVLEASQWLLVPGGIVHRRAGWRDKQATLHLFDRQKSIMCIASLRGKMRLVTVSDGSACQTTWMTGKERDMMLRAWLSPLRPLPIERYHDFV